MYTFELDRDIISKLSLEEQVSFWRKKYEESLSTIRILMELDIQKVLLKNKEE